MMLIDTHSHFGIVPTQVAYETQLRHAQDQGVGCGIITTGSVHDFEVAKRVAHQYGWGYAVGIHPLFVFQASDKDLSVLKQFLEKNHQDPHLVAIGEIGLDRFEGAPDIEKQKFFFKSQLELAAQYVLPVSVHSRRSLFLVDQYLRNYPKLQVALHAFSGSIEETKTLSARGYKMGFGGAMTYSGSKRVRAAAQFLPASTLLLETDCPDMPPAFDAKGQSEPSYLKAYLHCLAQLRNTDPEILVEQIFTNTIETFPKLQLILK